MFDIDHLDIKSLRLLEAISETGSVTQAARKRGITQSTASYGLEKMRQAFQDPLFIRQGQGVAPTERCLEILQAIRTMLFTLETIEGGHSFEAGASQREFVIAATGYEVNTLLVPLLPRLREHAPLTRLRIESLDVSNLEEKLDRHWDLALMSDPEQASTLIKRQLFKDQVATFYDPEQRNAPDTLERFLEASHACSSLGGEGRSTVDTLLERMGQKRKIGLVVPQFEDLARMIKGTTLITTLPYGLRHSLMRDYASCPCPIAFSDLPINMVWHEKKDSLAAHRWLRDLIYRMTRDINYPEP